MLADGKASWGCGLWNGYVTTGTTKAERRRRLQEVPEHLRPGVESHVRTVFMLMHKARRKRIKS